MQHNQEADDHNHQPLVSNSQNDDKMPHGFIYGTDIIEVNIGGVLYSTTLTTLNKDEESLLAKMFCREPSALLPRDSKGRPFIDRDGVLFRYILDYLRHGRLILPENFYEKDRLRAEAEHFRLRRMIKSLDNSVHMAATSSGAGRPHNLTAALQPDYKNQSSVSNSMQSLTLSPSSELNRQVFITIGYRGTFFSGAGPAEGKDVKFRKITRILVHGKVAVCREIFTESLNESRDPDRGSSDRYSSRFFLKHNFLEQAFDQLAQAGFRMVAGCASGTNSGCETPKPGLDNEENKWQHYNEYVFQRL